MDTEIYRSTNVNVSMSVYRPIYAVEVCLWESGYRIYIYDHSIKRPFLEVKAYPDILSEEFSRPRSLEECTQMLNGAFIHPSNWSKVRHLLKHERSAIIHPDMRSDVRKVYGYGEDLPKTISTDHLRAANDYLSNIKADEAVVSIEYIEGDLSYPSKEELPWLMCSPRVMSLTPPELRTYAAIGKFKMLTVTSGKIFGSILYEYFSQNSIVCFEAENAMCEMHYCDQRSMEESFIFSKGVLVTLGVTLKRDNKQLRETLYVDHRCAYTFDKISDKVQILG